jgi:hypothetical protein
MVDKKIEIGIEIKESDKGAAKAIRSKLDGLKKA